MISRELADKLTAIAIKQLEAGRKIKSPRMDTIKKIEDLYSNKTAMTLFGKIDIPLPFMAGHLDTVLAKIDAQPNLVFNPTDEADISLADKVTAAWKLNSSSMQTAWSRKDKNEKKLAILSGRGIAKVFADSVGGKYKNYYEVVDHNDFVCEGTQGHLEDQMYCGQENIFRVPDQIRESARQGFYDAKNSLMIIASCASSENKEGVQAYQNKFNRMQALGLDPINNAFLGQQVINLVEWAMEFEGERYYLLFNEQTHCWLRAEKLIEVFPCGDTFPKGIYPWVTWAPFEDPFNFWSKGFGDDVMPVAQAIRIIMNQTIINIMRRNSPTRAFDPSVFPDPNKLEWQRPDQLVPVNIGKDPAKGTYTFETPEIKGTLDLTSYLDNFIGKETGITAEAQGQSDTDAKVGVYYGKLQQVQDRIGTVEKSYNESYAEKGYRFYWGLRTHVTGNLMVQMIGKNGVQWEQLTEKELGDGNDFDIQVSGGSQQAEMDAVKQKRQSDAIAAITANPQLSQTMSAHWLAKNQLKLAGFDDEDLAEAFDTSSDADKTLMDEASNAIQMLLLGKFPRLNMGANAAFIQKIVDFSYDNLDYIKINNKGQQTGIDAKVKGQYDALMAYANAHKQIAIQNAIRKAKEVAAKEREQQGPPAPGTPTGVVKPPVPNGQDMMSSIASPDGNPPVSDTASIAGTAQKSQQASAILSP